MQRGEVEIKVAIGFWERNSDLQEPFFWPTTPGAKAAEQLCSLV